jgi:amino acid adenylation domain-containing protein
MKLPPEQEAIRAKCFHPSGTFVEFPSEDVETSIPARFEKMVRTHPHRIAIKAGEHTVHYDQLNVMANRVAGTVIGEASTAAGPVCMLIDNGPDLIATMLGILKAGRFFTLVDASFPKARIDSTVRDSQSRLLLHQKRHSLLAQEIAAGCKLVQVESLETSACGDNGVMPIAPTDPSTVIYTSGSTGQPKGVVHSHRSLLHKTLRRTNALRVSPEDRISLLSSGTSNVVSIAFSAILNGAALITFDTRKDGILNLKGWLQAEKISIAFISAQFFRMLSDSLTEKDGLPDLRLVRLSSEAARCGDFELFRRHFPKHCTLVNGLSSSETGVIRKYFMNHNSQMFTDNLPIGYPEEGMEIFLLDDNGQQVGFDNDGEIVVRSKYLASGYWNNPALSAAKFKQDPEDSEKRIYYTGDLALMRPDGCLIHKGRKDYRIKIRGYGVDLLEVEKALLSHPDIHEALITTIEKEDGTARLIAYFVCGRQGDVTVSELRNHLKNKLAEYMIPSLFIKLDHLPLTANGKIDRKALPKPDHSRPELCSPYANPQNQIEEYLVRIWEEVLDVRPLGIDDNFFDVGGHSLAATMVVSRVIQQFQIDMPLKSLFQSPTIADMAAVVTAHLGKTLDENQLEIILDELASLSDAEAQQLVSESNSTITKK